MSQEEITRSFDASSLPARLSVRNYEGSVQIRHGRAAEITVTAVKYSGNSDTTEIIIEQDSSGLVRAETRYPRPLFGFFNSFRPVRVDYIIQTPRECSIDLSVVSSSVDIEDIEGNLDLSTVSGDVTLMDATGKLKVRSVSGNVRGSRLGGDSSLKTVSGDVSLALCRYSEIVGSSVSGDFHVELLDPADGHYQFKTVSGDAHLVLPTGSEFTLSFHTQSGDIRTNAGSENIKGGRGAYSGTFLGGGAKISMRSVSGDLIVRYPDTPETESREESPVDQTRPALSELLERIDRGELSVEQALSLMNK